MVLGGAIQALGQHGPEAAAPNSRGGSGGPLGAIHAHVCGFHFTSGEPGRAVRVEHYCSHVNADVFQCVIYDSDKPSARG